MLYQQRTFTCPTSHNTSQAQWDLATLSPEEYQKKYSITPEEYRALANGEIK
jgi:hypothetical protein